MNRKTGTACRAPTIIAAFLLTAAAHADTIGFVHRSGEQFVAAGQPVYYVGASYYDAMNQASDVSQRSALDASFARLQQLGVTNVRIWASSEGPGGSNKITPTVQPTAGAYSETMLEGLDYALKSAKDHNLRAVLVLNNNWDWSGGMNQYVAWSPTTNKSLTNDPYGQGAYHDQFYTDANCNAAFDSFANMLVHRVNTAYPFGAQPTYRSDTTIFSWELANEPRAQSAGQTVLSSWINTTATYIKSIDPNHMVTTGSEGFINNPSSGKWWENPTYTGTDFLANHQSSSVDYATTHIWPFNWGWYPKPDSSNLQGLYDCATQFLSAHIAAAHTLGKPLVLEEFGLNRDNDHDGNGLPVGGPTTQRDHLFQLYYNMLYSSASSGGPAAGSNFWTWVFDPPQEAQDLNAVLTTDNSTLNVILAAARQLRPLVPDRGDANKDGKVDGADLAAWQKNFDPMGLAADTWAMGDWNADGKIDFADLAFWQQNYNPSGVSPFVMTQPVPEPGTFFLTALGVLGIIPLLRLLPFIPPPLRGRVG